MHKRLFAAGALVALAVSACSGSGATSVTPNMSNPAQDTTKSAVRAAATAAPTNVVVNPGFETGSLSPWTSCGSVNDVSVTTAQAHSGSYSALIGTTSKPEVNGTAGVCQTVTVPAGGNLLNNVSGKSRIGHHLEECAQRHHVAPEPVHLNAQAPHQNRKRDRGDHRPKGACRSHRQKESAVPH